MSVVVLLVDIPTGWEPRTEQQPTGLIAHPAAQGRAVQVLFRTEKEKPEHKCVLVFLGAGMQSKSEPFPSDTTSVASPKVTVCVPSL